MELLVSVELFDAPEGAQQEGENYLDEMERRMGGSGDLARLGPRSTEEFNQRNPSNRPRKERQLRGNQSSAGGFDSSNLAGAMGMEQGNTASVTVTSRGMELQNDNDPTIYLQHAGDLHPMDRHPGFANPVGGGKNYDYRMHKTPRDRMVYQDMRKQVSGY